MIAALFATVPSIFCARVTCSLAPCEDAGTVSLCLTVRLDSGPGPSCGAAEGGAQVAPREPAKAAAELQRAQLKPGVALYVAGLRCSAARDALLWLPLAEVYAALRAPDLFLYVSIHMPSDASSAAGR